MKICFVDSVLSKPETTPTTWDKKNLRATKKSSRDFPSSSFSFSSTCSLMQSIVSDLCWRPPQFLAHTCNFCNCNSMQELRCQTCTQQRCNDIEVHEGYFGSCCLQTEPFSCHLLSDSSGSRAEIHPQVVWSRCCKEGERRPLHLLLEYHLQVLIPLSQESRQDRELVQENLEQLVESFWLKKLLNIHEVYKSLMIFLVI